MDLRSFTEDARTVAAVERNLQKISEAAVRLGEDAEQLCPGPPWRNIRGIGTGCAISMTRSTSKPFGTQYKTICRNSGRLSRGC